MKTALTASELALSLAVGALVFGGALGGYIILNGGTAKPSAIQPDTGTATSSGRGGTTGRPDPGAAGGSGASAGTSTGGGSAGNGTSGGSGGGSSGSSGNGHAISLSGIVVGQLVPGKPVTLKVTINNTNNQDILVTSIKGSITSVSSAGIVSKPACDRRWFTLGEFSGSKLIAKKDVATVSLPVTLSDLATTNQDNCKGSTYSFSFTAQARQA